MPYDDHYFDVGVKLHYRDYPGIASTLPALCLPGLTRNCRDFEELALWLQQSRRVITPDLRGRGQSEADPDWTNYHPKTYVADMFQLLDHLEIDQCVVVGTSLGGLMAMLMAAAQPQRLAGVILNDVGPEISPEGVARIMGYIGLQPPVSSWQEAADQCREAYQVAFPDWQSQDWLDHARRGYIEDESGIHLNFDQNIGRALREVGGTLEDPWQLFQSLTAPTLLLRGALSDILPHELAAKMKLRKPDLQWVEIPDRGHAPTLHEPQAKVAIEKFLTGLER